MQPTNLQNFKIAPYCRRLNLSITTQVRAESILKDAKQAGLISQKSPKSLIGSALYIAGILEEERRTLTEISQIVGASAGTIQRNYSWLVRKLGIRRG